LIISVTCPVGQEMTRTLDLPRDRAVGMYIGRIGSGEKFQARRFHPVLIPARQEIANKISVPAREINPSRATVEASLRIIATAPHLELRQKRFAGTCKIKSRSRYSVRVCDCSAIITRTFMRDKMFDCYIISRKRVKSEIIYVL